MAHRDSNCKGGEFEHRGSAQIADEFFFEMLVGIERFGHSERRRRRRMIHDTTLTTMQCN